MEKEDEPSKRVCSNSNFHMFFCFVEYSFPICARISCSPTPMTCQVRVTDDDRFALFWKDILRALEQLERNPAIVRTYTEEMAAGGLLNVQAMFHQSVDELVASTVATQRTMEAIGIMSLSRLCVLIIQTRSSLSFASISALSFKR